MANQLFLNQKPPQWPPGRQHYLLEQFYFVDRPSVPLNHAARATAQCVARWADRYEAYWLVQPTNRRSGPLPADHREREALIDELLTSLERWTPLHLAAINLYKGGQPILEQSDGIPGVLALREDEFIQLQQEWEQHGLPRDLYYSATERHAVIEPVKCYGGVVRVVRHYTPRQWTAHHFHTAEPLHVPTEEEREQAFIHASVEFMEAILLRLAELSEPGQVLRTKELEQLRELLSQHQHNAMFLRKKAPPESQHRRVGSRRQIVAFSDRQARKEGKPPISHLKIAGTAPQWAWLPDPQRDYYLPEPTYFSLGEDRSPERMEALEQFHQLAARVTACAAARWADRYEAYLRGSSKNLPSAESRRGGPLPPSLQAREVLIEELFDWFDRFSVELYMAVLNLYQGKQPILHQSDGIPGALVLTAEEFAELQLIWEQHGLPRDLYYSARNQYAIIEPVERHGGIVRAYQYYSPLQWEQRIKAAVEPLQVPDEVQRVETFAKACEHFAQALRLRIAELSEPEREPDRAAIQRLRNLHQAVTLAAFRAQESLLPRTDEEAQ
jgi:hypothetical protein